MKKKQPEGFKVLQPVFDQFEAELRDLQMAPDDAVHVVHEQALWKIHQLLHRRSRFLFDQFYKLKAVSREVYDYCLRRKLGDANLIAKWKKQGYQKLCCLSCIQPTNHHYKGACVCRVPKKELEEGRLVQCKNCGCRGCASSD